MVRIFQYVRVGLDARLLAPNLAHYRGLGVERLLLDVNLGSGGDDNSPAGNHGCILAKDGGAPPR